MISAAEARRRTLLNAELKELITTIEKDINHQIEIGWYQTSITFSDGLATYLLDTLTKELESLGYKVTWSTPKPYPDDCATEQWDRNWYLRIDWA